MSKGYNAKTCRPTLTELKELLGPVLVLSSESAEQFKKVLDKLLARFNAQDIVDVILIRGFAEADWDARRYSLLRTVSFERGFKQRLDYQVQRIKAQRARQQQQANNLAEYAALKPDDIAEATRLEQKLHDSSDEVQEVLKRTPTELDHAHTLEKTISFHKDVEFIIASITKRRNEALQMLDLYRAGLGKQVETAMNEIIEGEYEEVEDQHQQVESPPLVPSTTPAVERRSPRNPPAVEAEVAEQNSPRKDRLTGWTSFQESKNEVGSQNSGKQGKLPQK